LIFGPWSNTEFYVQGGFSFHSNDVRGATQNYEPVSPDYPYPNTLCAKIPLLIQTKGAEAGVRTLAVPHLQSTLSFWYLHSNSELQQDGDTGGTVPSEQSSNRYGVEWANYYTPREHLAFDFDMADSRALFTALDPADATYITAGGQLCGANSDCSGLVPIGGGNFEQGPGGRWVPEAVGLVIASGITLHDLKRFSASLRLRDFGPRYLTSDAIYRSKTTALLNAEVGYKINNTWRVAVQFLNLLDRRDHDIDYAYISQITPTATPEFTDVFHPVEPFQVRIKIEVTPQFRR
jgi:outer membrane receptor protein involved in Fe transport